MMLVAKLLLLFVFLHLGAARDEKCGNSFIPSETPPKPPLTGEPLGTENLQRQIDALNTQVAKLTAIVTESKNDVDVLEEDFQVREVSLEIHQSCASLKKYGYTSGTYSISPSPDIEPFDVYCDMEAYPGTGVTVINHDSPISGYLSGDTYCSTGYDRVINYDVSMYEIESLINISNQCTQYISWRSYYNRFMYAPSIWWLSRDGEKMYYWGGATPDHDGYCSCGESGTCGDGLSEHIKCNADMFDRTWRVDAGNLIDKRKLPVSGLHFGFWSCHCPVSQGQYQLGPLKCF